MTVISRTVLFDRDIPITAKKEEASTMDKKDPILLETGCGRLRGLDNGRCCHSKLPFSP